MGAPIEVRELRKSFPVGLGVRKRTALDGMSFTVEQGEVYGFPCAAECSRLPPRSG
jgi:ABC-type multidrug transport system ATPase subunit